MAGGDDLGDIKARQGRMDKAISDLTAQVTGFGKDLSYIREKLDEQSPALTKVQNEMIAMQVARQHVPSPLHAVRDWLQIILMVSATVSVAAGVITYVARNSGSENQMPRFSLSEEGEPEASPPKRPAYVTIQGKRYRVDY